MNDDQFLLANAYLDGELTDDERRIAESDPVVMAEVESLAELRARIAEVDAPHDDVREAAIGAAMAEFARRGSIDVTPTSATAPRRRVPAGWGSGRYLAIAAAVVAIGLLGVIVANVGGRGQDDSADGAMETAQRDEAASIAAEPTEDAAESSADAESAADEMSAEMSVESSAETAGDAVGGNDDDVAAEMADQESSDASSDMSTVIAADTATAMAEEPVVDVDPAYDTAEFGEQRPDIDIDAPITDDLELGALGTYLLDQQLGGRLAPTPNTKCRPDLNILDERVVVLNGVETDVYIAVQVDQQQVIAVDRLTCIPLVDGPLFVDEP